MAVTVAAAPGAWAQAAPDAPTVPLIKRAKLFGNPNKTGGKLRG